MSSKHPHNDIAEPGPHDILCGRGGGTNAHPGNIKFRKLIAAHKLRYLAASKSDKPGVAREVVKEWRSLNPPGRFLAKMDEGKDDDGNDISAWYEVGDKKAREKASQCLRERNGAANEAVQALVKTVTAHGEACPEDYATLMNKAAVVKARNDIALQAQKEMLAQMSQMSDIINPLGMGGNGIRENMKSQPYGLSQQKMNDFSIQSQSRGFAQDNFHPFDQFSNQNSPQNQNQQYLGQMGNLQTEDDRIEAEIRRMLQQKQDQLLTAAQNNQRMRNDLNNMTGGGGVPIDGRTGVSASGGNSNSMNSYVDPQAYMGEESILREYKLLMQKQRHRDMLEATNINDGINNMNGLFNGINHTNNLNFLMNMPTSNNRNMNNSDNWMWNNPNGREDMINSNLPDSATSSMGFNNTNMFCGIITSDKSNSSGAQYDSNYVAPSTDMATNYLNGLRTKRKDGDETSNIYDIYSGGDSTRRGLMINDNTSSSMMGENTFKSQNGSSSMSGNRRGFTVEEYRASLQEFLAQDVEASFDEKAKDYNRNDGINNVFQVLTSLGDKKSSIRGGRGRDSMVSLGTFACGRSEDMLDMMSVGNSINDIINDDVLRNPELREKYGRKLSLSSRYSNVPGTTLEVKTMERGQGEINGPKKMKKAIDARFASAAGTIHAVQTKDVDGPTGRRNSVASFDSRMSFGNMSMMSELTDFGDMLHSIDKEEQEKEESFYFKPSTNNQI